MQQVTLLELAEKRNGNIVDIPKTKEKGEAQKTYVPGTNKFKEHVVEVVDIPTWALC